MLNRNYFIALFVFLLVLQGCVAVQSFPTVARAGDTVTLAVGSPDGMTKANTTAQYVPNSDSANPINLPIRAIVRIRPDNTSFVGTFHFSASYISANESHSPWLSIIILDLPSGLPVGAGKVNVTTSAVFNFVTNVNEIPISLEIIDGVGVRNPFSYMSNFGQSGGDLTYVEPMKQLVVRTPKVPFNSPFYNNRYGAVEIKLNAVIQRFGGGSGVVSDFYFRVVQDDMYMANAKSQTNMNWSRTGDEFTVNFTSPVGMGFFEPRFSIVANTLNGYEVAASPLPSLTSVTYYDLNGNVVLTDSPTVSDFTIDLE